MSTIIRSLGGESDFTEPAAIFLSEECDTETEWDFLQKSFDGPALDAANGLLKQPVLDTQEIIGAARQAREGDVRQRRLPRVSAGFTALLTATTLVTGALVLRDRADHSDQMIKLVGPAPSGVDINRPVIELVTPNNAAPLETAPPETLASTTSTVPETTTSTVIATTTARAATQPAAEVAPTPPTVPRTAPATTAATSPPRAPETTVPPAPEPARPEFRQMSGADFVNAYYNAQPQPDTVVGSRPEIYGDPAADQHIRQIAEARGYRLQPVSTTGGLNSRTFQAFSKMANAASNEGGVDLSIVSGYRSVDTQREIFTDSIIEYFGRTPTAQEIVSGAVDAAINETLNQRSAPGYSRHHSGYVVDINRLDNSFKQTAAYRWLSADNFYNARRFGFVPSYPDGVQAGPVPESWEFSLIANAAAVQ